ncbi:response regulator [Paenibacillus xylaniclasticus]|uniref:response regulator n=1 Tax=Paenibacillus xylaniclasticus TaxID=588083 RepID=UPI000FDA47E1|nr:MULTISPECIES: response regulator [Paenibacillus]GFN30181.1 AraC family transcriptional regulator [Paenibacillus curdlanolyticus]
MLKLMIVDDEQVERDGLQAIVQSSIPGLTIEQARNGSAAVEQALTFKPDLVLMDIKMPGISGLEAIELMRQSNPLTKFIMVTAYETFDYARQAIKLGVRDYLLKPSKASEIVAVVRKVIDELKSERELSESIEQERQTLHRMMPLIESDVVMGLLYDHVHEIHIEEMLAMLGGDITKEAFVMLIVLGEGQTEAAYAALKAKIRQLGCGWVGAMVGRQVPIIVFLQVGTTYRAQAASLVQQLLTTQQRIIGTGGFIGVGSPYPSLYDIRHSFREALLATADVSLPSRYMLYIDMNMEVREPQRKHQHLHREEKELIEWIRLGQWEELRSSLNALIDAGERRAMPLVQCSQSLLEFMWIVYRTAIELGADAERPLFSFQAGHYYQLRTEANCMLDSLIESLITHRGKLEPDMIGQIKQYITQHLKEEISLESIAQRVQMSPYYISKMFKDQLGINYIDFLTECRIDKAKKLMLDPQLSMKEITFEVGYNDPNYFSKVFKKVCGCSPSEYRKMVFR